MPLDPRTPNSIVSLGKRSKLLSLGVEMQQVSPSLLWLFLRENTLITTNEQWVKFLKPCME